MSPYIAFVGMWTVGPDGTPARSRIPLERLPHIDIPGYGVMAYLHELPSPTPTELDRRLFSDGAILINYPIGACSGALGPWEIVGTRTERVSTSGSACVVARTFGGDGWSIAIVQHGFTHTVLASGAQCGTLGIACADAAARLLGFTLAVQP